MSEVAYPKFSDAEYQRRRRLVWDMMKQAEVEALVICGSGNTGIRVHYLSNYPAERPTYLIYPIDGEPCLLVSLFNHIQCTKAMAVVNDVQWLRRRAAEKVAETLKAKGLTESQIGLVGSDSIPYPTGTALRQLLPGVTFKELTEGYDWIRWIRSKEELDWFSRSARLTDLTVEALEKNVKPGLSEYDLSAIIHNAFLHEGGTLGIHFLSSTQMENPDRCVPWQYLTPRILRKGDVVITEITVKNWGYDAQIHRPFAVGTKPTPLYQKLFDTALECFERVAKALKPGATTEDILTAGSVIEEEGFAVYDSLLHGERAGNPELGTYGSAHVKEQFTFKENMVVVIQPNPITKDQKAGLQLGAATLVTPTGAKCLHNYPFKFPVCG